MALIKQFFFLTRIILIGEILDLSAAFSEEWHALIGTFYQQQCNTS